MWLQSQSLAANNFRAVDAENSEKKRREAEASCVSSAIPADATWQRLKNVLRPWNVVKEETYMGDDGDLQVNKLHMSSCGPHGLC